MSKNKIYITFDENSRYSNHNNILTDIVKKLEDITNELNKENIEEIKERIYDIIIMTNRIITENYRSLKGINEKIKSLKNIKNDKTTEIRYDNGVFNGSFVNNKKEGKGVYKYNDGDKYEGEYKNDMRDGKGSYYYHNGEKYIGEWKEDKKHGKGICYFSNGDRYEGDFRNGEFHGFGIFYYNNGEKYIGEFYDSHRHGYGIKYFMDDDHVRLLKYNEGKKIDYYEPDF